MKRLMPMILVLFVVVSPGFAQDEYQPGLEIGIYGGLTIPLAEFGDKSLLDWEAHCGCAMTGISGSIKARARIKGDFFGVLGLQKSWNAYDPKPIAKALNVAFDAPFSVETNSWKSNIVQLGASYDFLVSDDEFSKWYLSFEATGLVNDLRTYFFRIQSPDGSNRYPLLQKSVDDTGFGYSFGTGLSVDWDGFGVRFTADYLNSSHAVKNADRRYNGGDLIGIRYNQRVQLLAFQIGIILRGY